MPTISYIVPVYRAEDYIEMCVASIAAQTHRDWEAVLVDDGSPDRSGAICDRLAAGDPRIRVVHRHNGGQAAARNTGLGVARGEYISFVDSDDLLHPQFAERLLGMMQGHGCEAAGAGDKQFKGQPPAARPISDPPRFEVLSGEEAYRRMLYQTTPLTVSVWGKVYRRDVWDTVRFTEGMLYEDLEVSARVFPSLRSMAFTPSPLYLYRQHSGSTLHNFNPRRLDALRAAGSVRRQVEASHPSLAKAAADRMLSACLNMIGLMAATGQRMPGAERHCWEQVRRLRLRSLLNPEARLKNRAGALLTYAGPGLFRFLSRLVYGRSI